MVAGSSSQLLRQPEWLVQIIAVCQRKQERRQEQTSSRIFLIIRLKRFSLRWSGVQPLNLCSYYHPQVIQALSQWLVEPLATLNLLPFRLFVHFIPTPTALLRVLGTSHPEDCNCLLPHFIAARITFLQCACAPHCPTSKPFMAILWLPIHFKRTWCILGQLKPALTHCSCFTCFQHKCSHEHTRAYTLPTFPKAHLASAGILYVPLLLQQKY